MDVLDSRGRVAGDVAPAGIWDWLCGIVSRMFGVGTAGSLRGVSSELSNPAGTAQGNGGDGGEDEEGSFLVAPCGYRIRIPSRENDAERAAGQAIPGVREALDTVPPLPIVVVRLIKEVQNPKASAASIAEIAASDPGLSATILRAVNSAAFGLNRKITAVSEAVNYLGFATVRSIVLKLRLDQVLPRTTARAACDGRDIWVHSLAVSYVADCLAERVADVDRGLASTLGLLHDIGKLAIVSRLATQDSESGMVQEARADESAESREVRLYGADHAGIGADLAHRWELPADLVQAIRWHHSPERAFSRDDAPALRRAVYLVQIANELAKFAYPYSDDMEFDAGAADACRALSLGQSPAELMDGKVQAAISRAILFGSETSSDSKFLPRRFLRLRTGESATKLAGTATASGRILVDDARIAAFWATAESTVNITDTEAPLTNPQSTRFVGRAGAAGIGGIVSAFMAHQQKFSPAPPAARREEIAFTLRALLANFSDDAGAVEITQSVSGGIVTLGVRAEALSFARRLGAESAAVGPRLVEAELASVLNLGWFESIVISADGATWLFRAK